MYSHTSGVGLGIISMTSVPPSSAEAQEKLLFDTGVFTIPGDVKHNVGWKQPKSDEPALGAENQIKIRLPHFDWTQPADYAHGKLYHRLEIISQPTDKIWTALQLIQEEGYNGDHWWPGNESIVVNGPGVYNTSHNVQEMRDATGFLRQLDNPPPICIIFVVRDAVKNAGKAPNSPLDNETFFPLTARFTWVAVAAGSTFSGWERWVRD